MIYEIIISEEADNDLRDIFEYIAYDLQSFKSAKKQIYKLEEQISSLKLMPERYKKYGNEKWTSRNLRMFPVDKFLIFYIPNRKTKIVTILRIMYAGQDIEKQLNKYVE